MKFIGTLEVYLKNTGTFQRDSWLEKIVSVFQSELEDEFYTLLHYVKQMDLWLRANDITDLIQLSLDDKIYYNDTENHDNDLEMAINGLLEEKIHDGKIFTFLLQEIHPVFKTAIQICFADKHEKGKPALTLTYVGVPSELLLQQEENPEIYYKRIQKFFQETSKFNRQIETYKKQQKERLNSLSKSLKKHMEIKRVHLEQKVVFHPEDQDSFFSYQRELWEKIHRLTKLSETLHQDPNSPAVLQLPSWSEYARRKVFNPKTGNLVQIRSLPPEYQALYRKVYVASGGNLAQTGDEKEGAATLWESLKKNVKRGWDTHLQIAVEEMKSDAPRTHAFFTNEAYRNAVLKESQKRIGTELYDTADLVATTFVKELWEMRHIPKAWFNNPKAGSLTEKELQKQEQGVEQLLDVGEFLVGTLIPVTAFSLGGPLGGMLGVGLVWSLAKSLEFNEDRKVTIAPSAWIERKKQIKENRKGDQLKSKVKLLTLRGGFLEEEEIKEFLQLSKNDLTQDEMVEFYANRFRDYGQQLIRGETQLQLTEEELKNFNQADIMNALAQESQNTSEISASPSIQELQQKIEQIELPSTFENTTSEEEKTQKKDPKKINHRDKQF